MDITAQEAVLAGLVDNQGRQLFWLELYQGIEAILKADPNMKQSEVGVRLGLGKAGLSKAKSIMGLLS